MCSSDLIRSGTVFGRVYGQRLVDYHEVESTDPQEAHRQFLQAKIQENFLLQYDRLGDVPSGVKGNSLNLEFLREVWSVLA